MKTTPWILALVTASALAAVPTASADLEGVCDASGLATCEGVITDCRDLPAINDDLCNPGCRTVADGTFCGSLETRCGELGIHPTICRALF